MTNELRDKKLHEAFLLDPHPSDLFYQILMDLADDRCLPKGFWTRYHNLPAADASLIRMMGYDEAGPDSCVFRSLGMHDRAMRRALLDDRGLVDSEESQKIDALYEEMEICGYEPYFPTT